MTQVCQTCSHSDRKVIDRRIVEGANLSDLARKYGLSYDSVYFHSKNHIHRQLATAFQMKEMQDNFNLLEKIESIVDRAEKIFSRNFKDGKDLIALKALSEQRQTFELLAKIAAHMHAVMDVENDIQNAEESELASNEISEGLKILTFPELEMFQKLIDKINMQDAKNIIIPEKTTSFETDEIEFRRTKMSKKQKDITKSPLNIDSEDFDTIKPIQSVEIPVTNNGFSDFYNYLNISQKLNNK